MHPLLTRALDLLDEGHPRRALEVLEQLLAQEPHHERALFESGMALLELDELEASIQRHELLVRLNPAFPGVRTWLASTYGYAGRHEDAARCLHAHLLHNEPTEMGVSPSTWDDCAQHFLRAGDADMARSVLETYLAQHAQHVTHYAVHGSAPLRTLSGLLMDRGEHARALELAKSAVEHPHSPPADTIHWIRTAARCGDPEVARRAWVSFRDTSYWNGYEDFPNMVSIFEELQTLTTSPRESP